MVKVKVELCDALRQKNHPLFAFFNNDNFVYLNKTDSNLVDLCPIKVKFLLIRTSAIKMFTCIFFQGHRFLRPYYTSYYEAPALIPTGMWRIDIIITKGEDEVFKVLNYYEVTARGIIEHGG